MKRADLVKGEHYAYSPRQRLDRSSTYATEVVLQDTELYLRPRYPRGADLVLAAPGRRPTRGDFFSTPEVGLRVLGTHEGAHEQLVLPQNLHMAWTDYLAWKEVAEAENAGLAARKREQEAKRRDQAGEITGLLADLGLEKRANIYIYRPNQEIGNDLLLEILRRAAAPQNLAKILDQENDRALKLRDDATSNGSGSNNNIHAQGRHDGYATGVRFAARLLRGEENS